MSVGYVKDGKYIQTAGLGFGGGWCGMPDWGRATAIPFVNSAAEQKYIAPEDGYIVGNALSYNGTTSGMAQGSVRINSVVIAGSRHIYGTDHGYYNVQVPINKGDTFSVSTYYSDLGGFFFVPFKAAAAGDGLSVSSLKQLNRLCYIGQVQDVTKYFSMSNVTLRRMQWQRYGNTVRVLATVDAVSAAFGTWRDFTADTKAAGMPSVAVASATYTVQYAGPASDPNMIPGLFQVLRGNNGYPLVHYTCNKAFNGGGGDALQCWAEYITDDPIPGEE